MSRVDDVERLIQVLAVLRDAEGVPVPRARLVEKVVDYKASKAEETSLKRKMDRDLEAMAQLGFRIDNVAPAGSDAAYLLHEGEWRLPVPLTPAEQAVLVWATASAAATDREAARPHAIADLIPGPPAGLDLVQAALAGSRTLVVEWLGEDTELQPVRLVSRQGRWFVFGRLAGQDLVKGFRLDRLVVVGLGSPITEQLPVPDVDEVLDPTAWASHESRVAELRCQTADADLVLSWFPRAEATDLGDDLLSLRFSYRNEDALVSRVIGLAGAAWIAAPERARHALRARVEEVLA